MKKVAPVGIILLAILAIVLVFLREHGADSHQTPRHPTRTTFAQVRGELPDPAGAPQSGVPEPVEEPEPDVAGMVCNQHCRAQVGIGIEAVDEAGRVLGHTLTDQAGHFEMVVDSVPPFIVRIKGKEDRCTEVLILPDLSLRLFLKTPRPREETLYIRAESDLLLHDPNLRFQVFNSLGENVRGGDVALADSPWLVESMPFGTYDIRVWNESLSGMARRFVFCLEDREAVVHLSPPALVRATPSIPVRAVLTPNPPMAEALTSDMLETDGHRGLVRSSLLDSRRRVKAVEFSELHAGEYVLTLTAPGFEPCKIPLVLAAGETRDLGVIEMEQATGSATFHLNDNNQDTTRHGYLLTLYTRNGEHFSRKTPPGGPALLHIEGLGAGTWHYRAERRLEDGALRSVNNDLSFEIKRDQHTGVKVNLIWPWD